MTRSPSRCTILSSSVSLDFHGASESLEEFVARIDFLALHDVTTTFFLPDIVDFPQFCRFISPFSARVFPDLVLATTSAAEVMVHWYQNGRRGAFRSCALRTSCRRVGF